VVANIRTVIAENVRYFRKKLGLSQEALGFKCNMPDVYISKLERGILNVGVDNLEKKQKHWELNRDCCLSRMRTGKKIYNYFLGFPCI
jgi:predicted transcriptional regulator